MQLTEVKDSKSRQDFLMVNVDINSVSSEYIRPLDKDINMVFDPAQNKTFRHGECTRWVLYSNEGKRIGRVAAFLNKKYKTKGDDVVVGGMGFFDCIDNQEAADLLFNVAKHWLLQHGAGAMDGPINFGERDRWWGLVVEGFISPMYCMNFNLPYYQQLFENYGFRLFFNQECFAMKVQGRVQEKFYERHALIAADPDFKAIHIRKNQLDKFAADFTTVY
ncbi:MAG: hypothetical protein EOO01_36385, partial [Chitinophagaceae bacterium]